MLGPIVGLVVTAVGVLMILLGMGMAWQDWKRRTIGKTEVERHALGETLEGLTKLLEVLKQYPPGQQMIVLGILLIIIGSTISGVSGLV